MVKLHLPTGIAACLAAAVVISCGNEPKPTASEPAAKIAHPGHVATEEMSTDREIMAGVEIGDGDNALWGYIDKQGDWVIPPRANSVGTWRRNESGRWVFARHHAAFTGAGVFSGGLAAVLDKETGLVGYIDNQGQWAISPRFDASHLHPFSMGLAPVRDAAANRFGYIDKAGAWAIEPKFWGYMGPFAERVAPVLGESESHSGCGYINQSGGWFIEPEYISCGSFYNGLAAVQVIGDYHLWGYINVDNEWVIEPQFDRAERFSDGLALVSLDSEHVAYINTSGQFVIGPEHQESCGENCRFVDGLAAKKDGSRWGYIDKSGAWAIEPQFTWASRFSEGLAVARREQANRERGRELVGYIDTQGEWVIEPKFESAWLFTRTTP